MRAVAAVALALLVVGCATDGDADVAPSTSAVAVATSMAPAGLDDVIAALEQTGADVRQGDRAAGTPFSVDAQLADVDAIQIRLYEYGDAASRAAEEATIAMDGWSVNHTPVEWIDDPHFWSKGRVIVLYLGDDPSAIELLTSVLGPEIDTG